MAVGRASLATGGLRSSLATRRTAPPTTEDVVDNPAAWHPDPAGKHDHRWWDGQRWTEHVADAGVASIDPLPAAPGDTTAASADDPGATGAAAGSTDADAGARGAGTSASDGVEATSEEVTDVRPGAEGDTVGGDPGTDPGAAWAAGGGAGASPAADQPVWGQQTGQQPPAWGEQQAGQQPTGQQPTGQQPTGQQPWGGAPASTPDWGQQQPAWNTGAAQPEASSGMAIAALVTGILSIPLLLAFGLGAVLGIVAVVLGIIALRRAGRGAGSGRGMAIGGIVTGAISIVLGILIAIFLFAFGFGVIEEMEACMEETGGDQAECQRRLESELTDRFLRD
jgi:hypothetical protein